MGKEFFITRTGSKRIVYTTKSGAKYIRSKNNKRYLTNRQIRESHKRNLKKKIPKKKGSKKKGSKKKGSKKSMFSLWGGWGFSSEQQISKLNNINSYEKHKTLTSKTF